MREILFRGKRKDNGEWVEGFYTEVRHHDDDSHVHLFIMIPEKMHDKQTGLGFWEEVIPETVGQFTGLTDKNGKKIFEGDIVESVFTKKPYLVCFGEYTYVDEYENDSWACGWYNEEKGGYITAFGCPEDWATVIGNIHDNPELLNGGNDNG